jgi:hypothetical protein
LEGIPEPWLERIALRDGIAGLAEGLLDLARPTGG